MHFSEGRWRKKPKGGLYYSRMGKFIYTGVTSFVWLLFLSAFLLAGENKTTPTVAIASLTAPAS